MAPSAPQAKAPTPEALVLLADLEIVECSSAWRLLYSRASEQRCAQTKMSGGGELARGVLSGALIRSQALSSRDDRADDSSSRAERSERCDSR
mmetsp:Transcript_18664/g.37893  ORF Transcript_18664/g.37893 Transcript_18664/m.37893 type:complete len:93 (+) Transcript_18664:414-692(+)